MGQNGGRRGGKRRVLATLGVLSVALTGVIGAAPAQAVQQAIVGATQPAVSPAPHVQPAAVQPSTTPSPAAALPRNTASCEPNSMFVLGHGQGEWAWTITRSTPTEQISSPTEVWVRAAPVQSGKPNALGVSVGGDTFVYSEERAIRRWETTRLYFIDGVTGRATSTSSERMQHHAPNGIQAGAVNPVNNVYYYGYPLVQNRVVTWHLYGYDLDQERSIGYVGYTQLASGYGSTRGDFAFSPEGHLYLVNNTGTHSSLVVIDKDALAQARPNAPMHHWGKGLAGPANTEGVAWLPDAKLGSQPAPIAMLDQTAHRRTSMMIRLDAHSNVGSFSDVRTISSRFSEVSDAANCAPRKPTATLSLQKALDGPRVKPSDQFTVQIHRGGAPVAPNGNPTTSGAGATVTWGTGSTGVVPVEPGTAYVLSEAAAGGADLRQYPGATLTCVDPSGVQTGLPVGVPLGSGVTLTPAPMSQIACTITNKAGAAKLATTKTLTKVVRADGTQETVRPNTTVAPGDVLHYSIHTVNEGVVQGSTVLTETVPAGTVTSGKNAGWSCGAGNAHAPGTECTHAVSDLAPGAHESVDFGVVVGDDSKLVDASGKPITDITIAVSSSAGVCVDGRCSVTTPLQPAWSLEKSAAVVGGSRPGNFVHAADTIRYTVTATGTRGITGNVVLTDDLSQVLHAGAFASSTQIAFTKPDGSRIQLPRPAVGSPLTTPAVTLSAGKTATLTFDVTVRSDAQWQTLTNRASGAANVAPEQCVTGSPGTQTAACVTTHRTTGSVTVEKVEEGGDALPGAAFTVSHDGGGKPGTVLTPNLVTQPDGYRFVLPNTVPGTYWLTETRAPATQPGRQPYQLLAQPIHFTVQNDGTVLLSPVTPLEAESGITAEGSTIRVENRPGFVLPNSGGLGTAAYTAIGVALLTVAIVAVVRRRGAEDGTEDDE